MDVAQTIEAKYLSLAGRLDEATLRLWVAAEARSLGRGGVSVVAKAAGVSRTTVYAGLAELDRGPLRSFKTPTFEKQRVRAPGGGRKTLVSSDPTLLRDLDALVEPTTRGDPMSPLRWTCKSTTRLAQELNRQGHQVSQRTVWPFAMGFFRESRVMAAWCELRQEFRHFRADRVADLVDTGTCYPTRRHTLMRRWREQMRHEDALAGGHCDTGLNTMGC